MQIVIPDHLNIDIRSVFIIFARQFISIDFSMFNYLLANRKYLPLLYLGVDMEFMSVNMYNMNTFSKFLYWLGDLDREVHSV